jgi:hypothetical protein
MKVRRIAARVIAVGVLAGGIALASAGVASADSGGGGHYPRPNGDFQNYGRHEGQMRSFNDFHAGNRYPSFNSDYNHGRGSGYNNGNGR